MLLLLVNSLSGPSVFVFQSSKVLFFEFPAVLIPILHSFSEFFSWLCLGCVTLLAAKKLGFVFPLLKIELKITKSAAC